MAVSSKQQNQENKRTEQSPGSEPSPARSRSAYKRSTYRLALSALFIALSIVLTRFASLQPTVDIRIGFGNVPIQLAGILLGPIAGLITGVLADPLGFILNPFGTYHPGFSLTSGLNGLIPGLAALGVRRVSGGRWRMRAEMSVIAAVSIVLITLICSVVLNTIWVTQLTGTPFRELLIIRIPGILLTAAIHLTLLILLLPVLKKAGGRRLER